MTPPVEQGPFAVLRRFVRPRKVIERCELCSQELPAEHPHVLELSRRQITCSCGACALLFSGQQGARYRLIPREGCRLPGLQLTDEQWDRLLIPINLAFFFRNGATGKVVALYPSPAGPIEALLPLDVWPELEGRNPVLRELAPDVEALLVDRVGERREHYRAPIDECFRLVGLIRSRWRGLSGGTDVWEEIERFFERLRNWPPASAEEGPHA